MVTSKTDGAERGNQVNSGGLSASRIGFKGTEDLGNGLKALFVLEYRVDIDQNTTIGGNYTNAGTSSSGPARQQLVGLTGGFGTAVAGRLQTTGYDWAIKYDQVAGTAFSPLQNVNYGAAAAPFIIGGTTDAARANNAIAYISPSFYGVTVALNHAEQTEQPISSSTDVTKTTTNLQTTVVNTTWDMAGIYYDNGPLSAGFVYATAKNNADLTSKFGTQGNKTNEWALGASYDFKVVKVGVTYQSSENEGNGITGYRGDSNDAWSISAGIPVTAAGKVHLAYAQNSIDNQGAGDWDTKSWTVAYTHAMSKRTTAYAGYNGISRGNDYGINVTNSAGVNTVVKGADTDTFLVGINHKF